MTIDDWGFANYSVRAIDNTAASEKQLVRFASVLPLQPAYAYSQGIEAADGWANIYSHYYRELWLRLARSCFSYIYPHSTGSQS